MMNTGQLKIVFIPAILAFSLCLIGATTYANKIIIKPVGAYSQKVPTNLIKIVSKPNSSASLFIPPGGCEFSSTNLTFTKNTKASGGMQCASSATLGQYKGVTFIIGFLTPGQLGQMCYTSYKISSQGFSGYPYHFKYHPNRNLTVFVSAHKRPKKYANSYPFEYILKCKGF